MRSAVFKNEVIRVMNAFILSGWPAWFLADRVDCRASTGWEMVHVARLWEFFGTITKFCFHDRLPWSRLSKLEGLVRVFMVKCREALILRAGRALADLLRILSNTKRWPKKANVDKCRRFRTTSITVTGFLRRLPPVTSRSKYERVSSVVEGVPYDPAQGDIKAKWLLRTYIWMRSLQS